MDAREFLLFSMGSLVDIVLFDPPYSPRQISECYKSVGLPVTNKETQHAGFVAECKDLIAKMCFKDDARVISFGWNSQGMGKKWGFEIEEILLVAHGGSHNDTICVVDKKAK